MHAPYTYIHVTHLTILWKNLQEYIQHTVYETQHVPIF